MFMAEHAADAAGLLCLEVLELNPKLDKDDRASQLAVFFIRSVIMGRPVYRSGRPA